jgi:hypothetical protein
MRTLLGITLLTLGWIATGGVALAANDATATGPVKMIVGNDATTSDEFKSGDDWLALACTAQGCGLQAATLVVTLVDVPTDHHTDALLKLHFSVRGDGANVLAWLHRDTQQEWIKPGMVITYASAAGALQRPATGGTMDVVIALPEHEQTRLVPLLDTAKETVRLQLRSASHRQMLDELSTCSPVGSTAWFRWAGDLDGDGKPDYLVLFPRNDGGVHAVLYLSSIAKTDSLVGIGGTFDSAVGFAGCGPGEWFPDTTSDR